MSVQGSDIMKKVTAKKVLSVTGNVLLWIIVHAFCGAIWLICGVGEFLLDFLMPWRR